MGSEQQNVDCLNINTVKPASDFAAVISLNCRDLLPSYLAPPSELVYNTTKHHCLLWKRETGRGLVEREEQGNTADLQLRRLPELCNPFELHMQHLAFCKEHFAVHSRFEFATFVSFSVILGPPSQRSHRYAPTCKLFTLSTHLERVDMSLKLAGVRSSTVHTLL